MNVSLLIYFAVPNLFASSTFASKKLISRTNAASVAGVVKKLKNTWTIKTAFDSLWSGEVSIYVRYALLHFLLCFVMLRLDGLNYIYFLLCFVIFHAGNCITI